MVGRRGGGGSSIRTFSDKNIVTSADGGETVHDRWNIYHPSDPSRCGAVSMMTIRMYDKLGWRNGLVPFWAVGQSRCYYFGDHESSLADCYVQ